MGGQGQHARGYRSQVAKWCEQAGVDALHVSTGSLFPHPLNPPGDLPIDVLAATYDALISSGVYGFRNFLLFRYPLLRPIFRWIWFRMKKGLPFEAISIEEARAIKATVSIPVISTGGYQTASVMREGIESGAFDGGRDRPLADRQSRPRAAMAGRPDQPAVPCTYCNKCLVNAPENPMGCYEQARFPSRDAMIEQLMSIYRAKPQLHHPRGGGGLDDERTGHRGRGLAPQAQLEGQSARRCWPSIVLVLFLAALIVGIVRAQAHLATTARRTTPTSSSTSNTARSARSRAAAFPTAIWKVLPALYPEEFEGRDDYSAFGFLYENDDDGRQRDLPIGVSQRKVRGVDVVWLNCATCHTGTWRADAGDPAQDRRGDAFQQSRLRPLRAHGLPAVDRSAPGARPPVRGDGGSRASSSTRSTG